MRFYMVDKVLEMDPGHYIEAVKCVSMADDVFNEHFPGYPVFPGTLMIEGLAQLSGMFVESCRKALGFTPKRAVLSLVQKMKFRGMVTPGDRLVYRSELKCLYPDEYAAVKVRASKDGKTVAEGEILFTFPDIANEEMFAVTDRLMAFAMRDVRIKH